MFKYKINIFYNKIYLNSIILQDSIKEFILIGFTIMENNLYLNKIDNLLDF